MRIKRPLRTIIVDDDAGPRLALQDLLQPRADIEIVGIAHDGREALRMIERIKPDLVFMDIDMPHLSGIDVARNLLHHRPMIIFATAFDRYAIHAFDVNAVDYILKPVTKERVDKSIARAIDLFSRKQSFPYEQFLQSKESFSHARKISFVDGNELLIMNMDNISCIETEGRYVRVYHNSSSHLFEEALAKIYLRLDHDSFVYASRSVIINLAHVKSLTRHGVRKFSVILDDPYDKDIPLARNRIDDIRERLKEDRNSQ